MLLGSVIMLGISIIGLNIVLSSKNEIVYRMIFLSMIGGIYALTLYLWRKKSLHQENKFQNNLPPNTYNEKFKELQSQINKIQ